MDDALASVLGRVASDSGDVTGAAELLADGVSSSSARHVAVQLVNAVLQLDARFGALYAAHAHKLVRSWLLPVRRPKQQWPCARCGVVYAAGAATPVFRCSPCDYTLCDHCMSATVPREQSQLAFNAASCLLCVLGRLADVDPSAFDSLCPHVVVAANHRLYELPPDLTSDRLSLIEIMVGLLTMPGAPRQLIKTLPDAWLPQPLSSANLKSRCVFGPLLSTTSLFNTSSPCTALWTERYGATRRLVGRLFATLLGHGTRDSFLIDATMATLSTLLIFLNQGDDPVEGVDEGMALNVAVALVNVALPILSSGFSRVQTEYHQTLEPRRGYPTRPTPLRSLSEAEEDALRQADEARLARAEAHTPAEWFEPVMERHCLVVCDLCSAPEFGGLRYKCAFCQNFDICEECYYAHNVQCQDPTTSPSHSRDHVFIRLSAPSSVIYFLRVDEIGFDESQLQYTPNSDKRFFCTACRCDLKSFDVIYRCANCISCRIVCPTCVAEEDEDRSHMPGHDYHAIPRQWRERFDPTSPALRVPQLAHSPTVAPPERFTLETEVFYLAVRALHIGPVRLLSRLHPIIKEMYDLKAFCSCEEQRAGNKDVHTNDKTDRFTAQYAASRYRLAQLKGERERIEQCLLNVQDVMSWLQFYSQTSRWLLGVASDTQNPFVVLLTEYSVAFSSFPEHFVFDLCDVVLILAMKVASSEKYDVELPQLDVESLLVMLLQVISSRSCAENPHLRVHALKALCAIVLRYTRHKTCHETLHQAFQRCVVLREAMVDGVLQFHEEMEAYHAENEGLAFANTTLSSQDNFLSSFTPIRASVLLLLRGLWRVPHLRPAIARAFSAPVDPSSSPIVSQAFQSSLLVTGIFNDITKLHDEVAAKLKVLRQLGDIREKIQRGVNVALPFRPAMLGAYVALHSKQMSLSVCVLAEILAFVTWAVGAGRTRRAVLKPELLDLCALTVNYALSSALEHLQARTTGIARQEDEIMKVVLSHVVLFVVSCAGSSVGDVAQSRCGQFEKVLQERTARMTKLVGDPDFHTRRRLRQAINGTANSEPKVDESSADADACSGDELDRTKGERHGSPALGRRFVAAMARAGRFDLRLFLTGCDILRGQSSVVSGELEPVDHAMATAFEGVLRRCDEVQDVQRHVNRLLADVPSQYLDPLLSVLMTDPVRVPSGHVVDRSVIVRHLLSGNRSDPFTRAALTVEQLESCEALREEIRQWVRCKLLVGGVSPSETASVYVGDVLGFRVGGRIP